MHVLVEIHGGITGIGTREHAHGEHRDAFPLQVLGLVHRGGGHLVVEVVAVVGLAVGEDDDHLLGVLSGSGKDVLRQIQAVVHAGGAGGAQGGDRILKGLRVAAHVRQVLDDLGVVVGVPIIPVGIIANSGSFLPRELDDADAVGHIGGGICRILRHLVDEAVDRGLQGSDLWGAARFPPGVQLTGPEGLTRSVASFPQPGAVALQPVTGSPVVFSCDLIVLVADLVVVGRAPPIRHIIIRPVLGTSGRIGVGLQVILHGAGYIQHQDDVQGGGGLGSGHLVGDVGLQAQLIAARAIGHFLVDDHAVRLRRYLAGTGPGVGCPCLDRQEAEHHHQRQNKG